MKHYAKVGLAVAFATILLWSAQSPARADNELAVGTSTFYVLVPGGDSSVSALAYKVTKVFQALFDRSLGPGNVWVIPRMSWGPNDLGDQCLNDPAIASVRAPQILGGIILEGTNTFTATDPYFIWLHGWSKVSAVAQVVSCQGTGFKKPTITWISGDLNGYGSRNGLRIEPTAGTIFALNPKNANAVDFAALALAGDSGSSPIPAVNDASTTHDALDRVVNQLFNNLTQGCGSANANLRPMCEKLGLAASTQTAPPAAPAGASPQASPKSGAPRQ